MSGESTPGQTGSLPCTHCRSAVFFVYSGGARKMRCPQCRKWLSVEVVHNGRKWKATMRAEPNR